MLVSQPRSSALTAAIWLAACGCAAPSGPPLWTPTPGASSTRPAAPVAWTRPVVVPVAHREVPPADPTPGQQQDAPDPRELPPVKADVLSAELLVEQVLARNPSLKQMMAAWQVASTRYPQVTSLDDPVFSSVMAPASIGSNAVNFGGRLEVSQKFPFPGKRALRGDAALAEASAAGHDVDDMRFQLAEAARLAFYELFLVERSIAVNEDGLKLMKEYRDNAHARVKNGLAPEQDVDQADVETGRQQERAVTLTRMRNVSIARINTLLNRPPDAPLPPVPQRLPLGESVPPVETLRAAALAQRADLQSLKDRLAAEQAAVASTLREYYPDFEAFAAYDSIMGNGPTRDLAPQVGVRFNVPTRLARRSAAVAEAQGRVAQRQAELTGRTNQVLFQVQEAHEQLLESAKVIDLYEKTLLPAAERNVKAAQAAYTTGKVPFSTLIEAKRNVIGLRDRYNEATADYLRRRATLDRIIGAPPVTPPAPPKPRP